jgi:hypothetical protein
METFVGVTELQPALALGSFMLHDFDERWGNLAAGSVWHHSDLRGARGRLQGIPMNFLMAAALDPRTKFLKHLAPPDVELIWKRIRDLALADLTVGPPQPGNEAAAPVNANQRALAAIFEVPAPLAQRYLNPAHIVDIVITAYRDSEALPMHAVDGSHANPLEGWKINERIFPCLAKRAKCILCVPATSAASERVFSSAGLTIANARARLLPNHATDLVMLRAAAHQPEMFGDII